MTYKTNDIVLTVMITVLGGVLTVFGWGLRATIDSLRLVQEASSPLVSAWQGDPAFAAPLKDLLPMTVENLVEPSWVLLIIGISMLVFGVVSIGFVATQRTRIPCPYCSEKVVPIVKQGSGHLRLSRRDEDEG